MEGCDGVRHDGRLNLQQVPFAQLRTAIRETWRLKESVDTIPIGKGFIIFRFLSESDMCSVWKRSPIKVGNQLMHFQRWRPDFKVNGNHQTRKLVWIRFPDLPYEYWHPDILVSLAKALGSPVALDRRTRERLADHFERVLVDIDISTEQVDEVMVERKRLGPSERYRFKQIIVYEDSLAHCGFCRRVGPSFNNYKDRVLAEKDKRPAREDGKEAAVVDEGWIGGRD
ncbi:uncharacterized protein LOC122663212 [Telopea speciosissima]|uniref:uncharacterized protein LOC122663212 n=1 Tax=Telopea speciosissima TaxID=54955 RepID=UPI001CC81F13|nr:uncharacterized protein LOC122663212 [Telopea speciosissima]